MRTRYDIATAIALRNKLPVHSVNKMIRLIEDEIISSLIDDGEVFLSGFGRFCKKKMKGRVSQLVKHKAKTSNDGKKFLKYQEMTFDDYDIVSFSKGGRLAIALKPEKAQSRIRAMKKEKRARQDCANVAQRARRQRRKAKKAAAARAATAKARVLAEIAEENKK